MIIYEGPSLINGEPIVAIATGMVTPSTNRKTGPMIQTWILAQSEAPHVAVKSGVDEAVCGDCPARGKWCYVTTFQGPRSIWESWNRGGYPPLDVSAFAGKPVRFGAYGDPAAVPFHIWDSIGMQASMVTGYTHAWHYCDPLLKQYCMASCDTLDQAMRAQDRGWRTFRVTSQPGDKALSKEVICPASEEAGHKLTCIECGACNGASTGRKSHIVIAAHGAKTKGYEQWEQDILPASSKTTSSELPSTVNGMVIPPDRASTSSPSSKKSSSMTTSNDEPSRSTSISV